MAPARPFRNQDASKFLGIEAGGDHAGSDGVACLVLGSLRMDGSPGQVRRGKEMTGDLNEERFTRHDIDGMFANLVLIRERAAWLRRALLTGPVDQAALAAHLREIDAETERINLIITEATRPPAGPNG